MRPARAVAAALVLAAALGLPDAASAAFTVSYNAGTGLSVQGDAGSDAANVRLEDNGHYAVFVGSVPISPLRIPAATLVRGEGCTQPEPRRIDCNATGNRVVTGSLGDGSDMLEALGTVGDMFLDGGAGADLLRGGTGFDAIDGGAGNDFVGGGGGNDVVEGGDGKDTLQADGSGAADGADVLRGEGGDDHFRAHRTAARPDRFEGGPGDDMVEYSLRTPRVVLTVSYGGPRAANDGQAGEGDDIGDDVETLVGGEGDDAIEVRHVPGTPAPSRLKIGGNAGNDRLSSETDIGTDFDPGIGVDAVNGSSVADRVLGRDAENDRVDCNGGIDAFVADLRDTPISPECEQVDQGAVDEGPNVVVRSKALRVARDGTVAVRLRCPRKLRIPCAGRLALRLDGSGTRFGGATRYRMRRGRAMTVRVTLPAAQRSRARRRGARLRLRSVERGSHGPKTTLRSLPA